MKKNVFRAVVVGVLAVALGGAYCFLGSFGALAARLNGETFYLSPRLVDLGDREPGAVEFVTFRLQNLTSQEINVVGEKSTCTCAATVNLPLTVAPRETVELKMRVALPTYDSQYDQTVDFMVATGDKLRLPKVRVVGNVPNPLPYPGLPETDDANAENETSSETTEPAPQETESAETP